ncbi:hypothetical protein AAMO2058_000192600 [Amorphochlora amoebiformis]
MPSRWSKMFGTFKRIGRRGLAQRSRSGRWSWLKRPPTKRLPWIRRLLDRRKDIVLMPGLTSWRQIDSVFILLISTMLTSVIIDTADPVMRKLGIFLLTTQGDYEDRKHYKLLWSAWLPAYDTGLFGAHWIILTVPVLACRASTRQILGLYTLFGIVGQTTQGYFLEKWVTNTILEHNDAERTDWEAFKGVLLLNGSDPALQGLKGAALASVVETAYRFRPLRPPIVPLIVAGLSVWSLVYFHFDILPSRMERLGREEHFTERASIRANQAGAACGFMLFWVMARWGKVKAPLMA